MNSIIYSEILDTYYPEKYLNFKVEYGQFVSYYNKNEIDQKANGDYFSYINSKLTFKTAYDLVYHYYRQNLQEERDKKLTAILK